MAFVSSVSNVIVESLSNTTNKNNMRELLRRVAVRDATGVLLVVVVVVELKFIISPAKIESLRQIGHCLAVDSRTLPSKESLT